jgi:D-arabinose 1-dehydrogenase-like Zn-dependent alcohol dehydrogenase
MVPEIVVVLLSHWYEYDLIEPHAGVIAPYATLRSHPGGGGRVVVVGVGGVLNNAVTVAPIARSTFEMAEPSMNLMLIRTALVPA